MSNMLIIKRYLILVFCCYFLVGCISTKYVERKQYLLEMPKNLEKNRTKLPAVFVEHVTAIAPFDKLDFIYRQKSGNYLLDYYNGFLVSPVEQLDAILKSYLNNPITTDYQNRQNRLQVKLIELYADYRHPSHPQAAIALQFHLTQLVAGKTNLLFTKVFRANVALQAKDTNSLLQAWHLGIQDVLSQGLMMLEQTLVTDKKRADSASAKVLNEKLK